MAARRISLYALADAGRPVDPARGGTALTAVYLSYSQAELDDCYDQRVWARDAAGAIARLGRDGAAVRAAVAHRADIPYGPGPNERLDWFHAASGAPIHLHVHGGAWRNLAKEDASFAAPAVLAAGAHHVVVNFSKLPAVRLPDVVEELARAVAQVAAIAEREGGDPERILLSGHSSGAHLAACLLTLDPAAHGWPADVFKAALLVGGLYDLEPVLLSARGSYVRLAPDEAERLSPIRHAARVPCPVTLVHGGRESPDFIRQARAFAAALDGAGKPVSLVEMAEADHFDVNAAFGIPGSPVHAALVRSLSAMTSSGRAADAA